MGNAGTYLVDVFFTLATFVFIARFLLQACQVNFYNPVSQGLVKLTDPVLKPARMVLPTIKNIDLASFVFAWAAIFIKSYIFYSSSMGIGLLVGFSALETLQLLITFLRFAIIGMIIISFLVVLGFVNYSNPHPIIVLLHEVTEPLLAPVRKFLPAMGGFDFSPLIVLVGLQVVSLLLSDLFQRLMSALL